MCRTGRTGIVPEGGRVNRNIRRERESGPDPGRIAQMWNVYRAHTGRDHFTPEDVIVMQALLSLSLYDHEDGDGRGDAVDLAISWLQLLKHGEAGHDD